MRLSPTAIRTYLMCPRRYEFSYIDGIKLPPNGVLVRGRSYHDAARANFQHKHDTQNDMDLPDLLDAYSSVFDREIADAELREGEVAGKLKDSGALLVTLFREERAPDITPALFEEKIVLDLASGDQFSGIIDLATPDDRIIDLKSSSKKPPGDEVHKDSQLTAYGWQFYHLTAQQGNPRLPSGYALDYAIHDFKTENGKARLLTLETTRTADDLNAFAEDVAHVFTAIKAGAFPRNQTGWHCSEVWCGYWDRCRKGRG